MARKRAAPAAVARRTSFDKYYYYSDSVQDPEEASFLDWVYRDSHDEDVSPRTLREDFCGTFANCCAWVKLGASRVAIGVDLDSEPIEYGCANHWKLLRPLEQARVRIIQGNVLDPGLPRADVIAALNFSYFIFKSRGDLLAYLRNCHGTLEPGGVLVLDCFGGRDRQLAHVEQRSNDEYTYSFEQMGYEPVTHEAVFHIHIERKGERKRERLFTYDWRMWTLAELRDALRDAGFESVRIYLEGQDQADGMTEFELTERIGQTCPRWRTYIAALR
jgi:SAM-dependent methyltransferase